jgi:hypothetical protein
VATRIQKSPLEKLLEASLKEVRQELFQKVRQRVWELLPKHAVRVTTGSRSSEVRIGEVLFTMAASGAVTVELEPLPELPPPEADAKKHIRNLRETMAKAERELSMQLQDLVERACTKAIADTGFHEEYSNAVKKLIRSKQKDILSQVLSHVRVAADSTRDYDSIDLDRLLFFSYGHGPSYCSFNGADLAGLRKATIARLRQAPEEFARRFANYVKVRMILGAAFGVPLKRLALIGLKTLASTIDRHQWDLVWRSSPKGRVIHLSRFRWIAKHRRFYEQVQKDCPALLKLFAWTFEELLSKEERAHLVERGPLEVMVALRDYWRRHGLTQAGWNLLHKQDAFQRNAIYSILVYWTRELETNGAEIWATIVSESVSAINGRVPRYWNHLRYSEHFWHQELGPREQVLGEKPWNVEWRKDFRRILNHEYAKAARETCALRKEAQERIRKEHGAEWRKPWQNYVKEKWYLVGEPLSRIAGLATQIQDYAAAIAMGRTPIPLVPKNAGIAWLKRASDRWHQELDLQQQQLREAELARRESITWDAMPEIDDGVYRAVMLNNGRLLAEEGRAMHHCVGDYTGSCAAGHSRIFSIREAASGKRCATMELIGSAKSGWTLRQVFAPCNQPVNEEVYAFAKKVLTQSMPYLASVSKPKRQKRAVA